MTATNGGTVSGIDIRITDPDGIMHQYTTNSSGKVPFASYGDWLFNGRSESFTVTIKVLGEVITKTFSI